MSIYSVSQLSTAGSPLSINVSETFLSMKIGLPPQTVYTLRNGRVQLFPDYKGFNKTIHNESSIADMRKLFFFNNIRYFDRHGGY